MSAPAPFDSRRPASSYRTSDVGWADRGLGGGLAGCWVLMFGPFALVGGWSAGWPLAVVTVVGLLALGWFFLQGRVVLGEEGLLVRLPSGRRFVSFGDVRWARLGEDQGTPTRTVVLGTERGEIALPHVRRYGELLSELRDRTEDYRALPAPELPGAAARDGRADEEWERALRARVAGGDYREGALAPSLLLERALHPPVPIADRLVLARVAAATGGERGREEVAAAARRAAEPSLVAGLKAAARAR